MANYATLKAAISQVIKENGNKEITGAVMQTTLLAMVDSMASGYTFAGVATPSTSAGTPDENVFWIGGAGSYSNFGATTINVPTGCICIFTYNGSFASSILYVGGVVDISKLTNTSYASLSQALADVPSFLQVGGLEVMYQDSTSGNYVKYRLMATSWSTTVTDWQKQGAEVSINSNAADGGYNVNIASDSYNVAKQDDFNKVAGGNVIKQLNKIAGSYYDNSGTLVAHDGAEYTEPYTIGEDVKKIYIRGNFNPNVSTSAFVSILRIDGAILFRYREAEMAASGGATLNIASYRQSNPESTFTLQTSSTIASNLQVVEDKDGELPLLEERVENIEQQLIGERRIECWGDSLTAAGIYEQVLSNALPNHQILNCGIASESCYDIGARIGALSLHLRYDVILPATYGAEVKIGDISDSGLYVVSTLGEKQPTNYLKRQAVSDDTVNQLYIDGYRCVLVWSGNGPLDPNGEYRLANTTQGLSSPVTLKADTLIVPYGVRVLNHPLCSIIWMGTNGGYDITSTDGIKSTLVAELKNALAINRPQYHIIVGLHLADTVYRENLEAIMAAEFGPSYFNLRHYLVNYAMRDSGLTPTSADEAAIAAGNCPPSLLADGVHFTNLGYQLIGQQILQRLKDLGVV